MIDKSKWTAYKTRKKHTWNQMCFSCSGSVLLSRAAGALRKQSCGLFLAQGTKYHKIKGNPKGFLHCLVGDRIYAKKEHSFEYSFFIDSGDVLLSQAVTHQVSSALKSLTTVFGMGTGVTSLLLPPNVCQTHCCVLTRFVCLKNRTEKGKITSFFLLTP